MRWLALLAIFFVAGCGSFGAAQPHSLSLAYKAGDTYKYKLKVTSKQSAKLTDMTVPIEIDTTANESVKVKSVDSAGVADLTITFSDLALKTVTAGVTNTTTGLPFGPVDVKIKSDGTVVSIDGDSYVAGSPMTAFAGVGGGFFIAAVLPGYAVKVGDTWSKTHDQTDPRGFTKEHITSNSRYVRDEITSNVNTAVVETKSDGTIQTAGSPATSTGTGAGLSMSGTFTTDVTTWIDPNGHRIVRSHATAHDDITLDFAGISSDKNMAALQGPIRATGDSTTDLTPV
jgi:hypothetical protein